MKKDQGYISRCIYAKVSCHILGGRGSRELNSFPLEGGAPAEPLFFIWRARLPPSRFSSFGGRGSRQAAFLHLEGKAPAEPLFFIWRARLPPSRFSSFGGRGSRQARFSSFGGRGSRQAAFLHLEGEAPAKPWWFGFVIKPASARREPRPPTGHLKYAPHPQAISLKQQ